MKRLLYKTFWDLSHPVQTVKSGSSGLAQSIAVLSVAIVILLALIGGTFASWYSWHSEKQLRNQIERTQIVLTALRRVRSSSLDAETGQRGFLVTRERGYLDSYENGRQAVPKAFAVLKKALEGQGTPFQMQQLKLLEKRLYERFEILETTIELVKAGQLKKAVARVDTEEGKNIMDEVRAIIRSLESQEETILRNALVRTEEVENTTTISLIVLAIAIVSLSIVSVWLFVRSIRLEEAQHEMDLTEAKLKQSKLLTREMNHRIKNLFAIVAAIISRSGQDADTVEKVVKNARERVLALARSHEITQGKRIFERTPVKDLVENVLDPYIKSASHGINISGDESVIPQKFITPFGLILHEWATNAIKYGALSEGNGGMVWIEWAETKIDSELSNIVFHWRETGGPKVISPPEYYGFGCKLAKQAAEVQMSGNLDISWPPEGFSASLTIPITSDG